ncbi:MAG: cation diffusion facilitator family transporter [Panacagrimonas sp.]
MSAGHHHHHGHDHDHGHSHPKHVHDDQTDHADHHAGQSAGRLKLALGITLAILLIEAIGGWWTHSLALIADAGHVLADAGSLLLAILALRQAAKPADAAHSYGHGRFPVLAAFVNGLLLLAVSAWIAMEAVQRLIAPERVDGLTLSAIALIGLVGNLAALGLLHGGHEHDLNRQGAAAHVLSDLLGSIAAVSAGLIIWTTGWTRADPLLSMLAALLIVRTGIRITRESAHVLLEGAPKGLDLARVAADLPGAVPGVTGVHHLHAWSLTPGDSLMTLHAVVAVGMDADRAVAGVRDWLRDRHRIGHVTVQIEREDCGAEADCSNARQ